MIIFKKMIEMMIEELDGMKGYRESQIEKALTEEAYNEFNYFMLGQTVSLTEDGESFIYYYNFDNFVYHYKGKLFR